jgi:hypothetical protein
MTTKTSTCTWDTGAMYDCAPACSQPATKVVRYRRDSYPIGRPYFEALACTRHARTMEAYAESGWVDTVPLETSRG